MINTTEKETQKTILHYLQLRRYVYWRTNNAPIYDPTRQMFRKMATHSRKGVADIFVIKDGVSYFIEVKGTKGVLSTDQKEFRDDVTRQGGIFIVAKSVDDVIKIGL